MVVGRCEREFLEVAVAEGAGTLYGLAFEYFRLDFLFSGEGSNKAIPQQEYMMPKVWEKQGHLE